jgi:hypothetical protein
LWKIIYDACQYGQEVSYEGANRSLCCVLVVNMGWYQLVVYLPLLSHKRFVLRTNFIVKDLEIHMVISRLEALNDGIIRLQSMSILSGLEGGNKDCIGRSVKSNHDILVAASGSGGETTCIISIQLANRFHGEM